MSTHCKSKAPGYQRPQLIHSVRLQPLSINAYLLMRRVLSAVQIKTYDPLTLVIQLVRVVD
jgi:hypothetical protein